MTLMDYFQIGPIPIDQYTGSYDLRLVFLSFLVAVAASFIALDLTGRLRDASNTSASRLYWLIGGAIAMGAGIWSMHFIGMLSFTIQGLTLRYDLFWTGLSLVVAILASGFALFLLQSKRVRLEHYVAGGVILGLAIASMHYTGMEGMLITLNIRYLPSLFLLSIIIAIVASEAALWLALKSTRVVIRFRNKIKFGSAIIMGVAICGMHYTGMAASIFTPLCYSTITTTAALDPNLMAIGIAAVTFIILGVAFFASAYKEAMNLQQFEKARQLGMAEISASVLHSVGNVLNSVNVSTQAVAEKISQSKLSDLNKLATLFDEHKDNFVEFITEDPRGTKALGYVKTLADYWQSEKREINIELTRLAKNLHLIKEIISTQQSLSKTTEFEELISINDLLEEAILITGLNIKKEILVNKHYGNLKPIKLDKVKLLQVLVNLLRNAKDSVIASKKQEKIITIKTILVNKNKFRIEVIDNGIGITQKNLKFIFNYGFTTKSSGHGFGLHTSALAVNHLGGTIEAHSEGKDKGATFVIELATQGWLNEI